MSALVSSIALRWSGVSTNGKLSSISCCHGVSWRKCVAGGVDPLLVEHHQFLGDLANGGFDLGLGLGEIGAAEPVQYRGFAADVLADGVDLIAGDVELVAALVGEQQIVTLDAADAALDHALVVADAVLVVHNVVAGLQVFEEPGALPLAWPRLAMGAASSCEITFGNDRDLGRGHDAAAMQWGDDHPTTRLERDRRRFGRAAKSRPRSRSRLAMRWAEPSPSAATTTRHLSRSSSIKRLVKPSPSPTTGPQPLALTIGESGFSGVTVSIHAPAGGTEQRVRLGVQPGKGDVRIAIPGAR